MTKVLEEIKTHFMFSNFSFLVNLAVCEIMWKNLVEKCRPQTTVWRMRIACWITKVTDTRSQYIILITFHCNSGCTNAPVYYVVLFIVVPCCCMLFQSVLCCSNSCTSLHFKILQSVLYCSSSCTSLHFKTLKSVLYCSNSCTSLHFKH
jgi:hypothetical protein